ncbi:hypothetical protein ACRYI5_00500 [Furfurilactobacillus sp. WILCCON 0119]
MAQLLKTKKWLTDTLKILIKSLLLFFITLTLGLSVSLSVEASSFKKNFQKQTDNYSDPQISIKSQKNSILVLTVAKGFHPSSDPESYAYYALYVVKRSHGWTNFNAIQMNIHGYYDESDGTYDKNKTWTISTIKLKEINLSDKALDKNDDHLVDVDEVRDFSATLPSHMDSIQ